MLDSVRYSADYQRSLSILAEGGVRRLYCGCLVHIGPQLPDHGPFQLDFAVECDEARRLRRLWPGPKHLESLLWCLQDHACDQVQPWWSALLD